MKLKEIVELLDAKVQCGEIKDNIEISCACGSDLMSDVMAFVQDNVLLLTGLVNPQVIRTAEFMDIDVIVFVRGKKPGEETLKLAKSLNKVILTTKDPMFIACGKLYSKGLVGKGVRE